MLHNPKAANAQKVRTGQIRTQQSLNNNLQMGCVVPGSLHGPWERVQMHRGILEDNLQTLKNGSKSHRKLPYDHLAVHICLAKCYSSTLPPFDMQRFTVCAKFQDS